MIKYLILIFLFILLLKKKKKFEKFDKNKETILITGSNSGIGLSLAKSLDPNKYQLIITGRNIDLLNENEKILKEKGLDVLSVKADLKNENEIINLVDSVINKYGKIDIFINNMYYIPKPLNFNNLDIEGLKDQIKVNFTNNIILTNYILKYMKESNSGKIINIGSGASNFNGSNGNNYAHLYIIIKNFIEKFTKLLSMNFYKKNISITCLKISESYQSEMNKNFNLKLPEELNPIFKYLLESDEINGKIIDSRIFLNNKEISLLELPFDIYKLYSPNNLLDDYRFKGKKKMYLGENILGMSPNIKKFIKDYDWDLSIYPSKGKKLNNYLTNKFNIQIKNLCFIKGITNTLNLIATNFVKKYHQVLTTDPSWFRFIQIFESKNSIVIKSKSIINNNKILINFIDLVNKITPLTRLIYLVYPFNIEKFKDFLTKISKNIIIIVDMCYYDFVKEKYPIDFNNFINDYNILFLFSMSKFYGLAGLESGYSIGNENLIKLLISNINYPISQLKEEIMYFALNDNIYNNYVKKYYDDQNLYLINKFNENNISFINSERNFFYIKYDNMPKLKEELEKFDILYNYSSDIQGYSLFILNNEKNNNIILNIFIKLINNI